MTTINLQPQLGLSQLNNFFDVLEPVINQLNKIIEVKNGKKNAITIKLVETNINISYQRTEKSNGMFLDVTIRPDHEFDERLEWVIQAVFNACRDNDCFELVRVYGAKERGMTMGFKYSANGQNHDCVLWKRPEVTYILMRHAEPEDHGLDLTNNGYKQSKSVATKLKELFPEEIDWAKNCSISLPSGVLRITCTASEVGAVLGDTVDNFNINRREWLGLKSLDDASHISYGAHQMTQNADFKYQIMFTHWDVAAKAFPTFMKDLKLKEDLSDHKLEHAECIVMYPDGKVVHLLP